MSTIPKRKAQKKKNFTARGSDKSQGQSPSGKAAGAVLAEAKPSLPGDGLVPNVTAPIWKKVPSGTRAGAVLPGATPSSPGDGLAAGVIATISSPRKELIERVAFESWALATFGGDALPNLSGEVGTGPEPLPMGRASLDDEHTDGFKKRGHKEVGHRSLSVIVKVEEQASEDSQVVKAHFCTYLARLHTTQIFALTLFAWEVELLIDKSRMSPRAVQIVCWRRSVLEVSCVFYFISLCFEFYSMCNSILTDYQDYLKGKVFGMELGDYADHFKGYVVLEYFFQGGTLLGHFLALIFCIVALLRWRNWAHSVRWTCYAYALGYVTPFILLMITPFHSGIDMKAVQQQFCKDMLSGAPSVNSTISWQPAKLVNTLLNSGFPGTERFAGFDNSSTLGLRALLESKGIILPSTEEFCTKDPGDWEEYVDQLIQAMGRMSDGGGACFAAPQVNTSLVPLPGLPDLTLDSAAATQKCQQAPCDTCGSDVCLAQLPTLLVALSASQAHSMAFNVTGVEQIPSSAQQALSKWGLDASPSFKGCMHCVDELQDAAAAASTGQVPSCASLCLPLWAAGQAGYSASSTMSLSVVQRLSTAYTDAMRNAQWALDAAEEAQNIRICVDKGDLTALEILLQLGSSTKPFQTILGIQLAFRALCVLLPGNFAMMLGALKGSCISKTTVPYSRVPGIILITAVVFSLPHLATLMILIKSILGDLGIMFALSFFLLANMIWLPVGLVLKDWGLERYAGNGLMEPSTHIDAAKNISKRQTGAMICYILMVVCIIIWFCFSEALRNFLELGFAQVEFRDLRKYLWRGWFWRKVGLQGIMLFTSMYGLTKVSMVFFADVCLYALLLVDENDNDPKDESFRQEHGDKEQTLFLELHTDLQPQCTESSQLPSLREEMQRLFKGRFNVKKIANIGEPKNIDQDVDSSPSLDSSRLLDRE